MKGSSRSAILEDISLKELAEVLQCRAQEAASTDASKMSLELICDLDRILTSTLTMIRRMLNSRQRSTSLPPEILSTIFQFVPSGARVLANDLARELSNVNTMALVPLTQVCYRWREVALSTPSLWSNISDRHPPSFLERSGSVDLVLTITREPKANHFIYDLLRSGRSRIREMYWSADVSLFEVSLPLHLAFPAPHLRILYLRCGCSRVPPGTVLFQGHTPQLEYLSLRFYIWMPPESIISLTHLFLSDIPNLGVDDILSFLSKTPNLETLVVKELIMRGSNKMSSVPLKNLTRLTFDLMESGSVSSLIRHLEISPSVAVQAVYCGLDEDNGFCSLFTDLPLIPTSIEVAGTPNDEVVISAVNSSMALRCISYDCDFYEDPTLQQIEQDIRELWIRPGRAILSAIMARNWIHLETLISCGYKLGSILKHLSMTPVAPGLSTIRLIQRSPYKKLDLSVQQEIKEKFMLVRKDCAAIKLMIEYHVLQRDAGHRVTQDVEMLFECVEYKFFEEAPTMAYPDICKSGWPTKYPPWVKSSQFSG